MLEYFGHCVLLLFWILILALIFWFFIVFLILILWFILRVVLVVILNVVCLHLILFGLLSKYCLCVVLTVFGFNGLYLLMLIYCLLYSGCVWLLFCCDLLRTLLFLMFTCLSWIVCLVVVFADDFSYCVCVFVLRLTCWICLFYVAVDFLVARWLFGGLLYLVLNYLFVLLDVACFMIVWLSFVCA